MAAQGSLFGPQPHRRAPKPVAPPGEVQLRSLFEGVARLYQITECWSHWATVRQGDPPAAVVDAAVRGLAGLYRQRLALADADEALRRASAVSWGPASQAAEQAARLGVPKATAASARLVGILRMADARWRAT